jgi:hypothetical protein
MTITTEEAELLARISDINGPTRRGAIIRSLAAERDALRQERDALQAKRDHLEKTAMRAAQRHQAAMVRADKLQAEYARRTVAMEMARDCLEDKDVIGAKQTLTLALGEKE